MCDEVTLLAYTLNRIESCGSPLPECSRFADFVKIIVVYGLEVTLEVFISSSSNK